MSNQIRCYEYINHPYAMVKDALTSETAELFQSATKAAAARAGSVASELHADFGGIGLEADIKIAIKNIETKASDAISSPVTRLQVEWQAAKLPQFFPLMKAEISIYPLTKTETQLDFSGVYEPPLGAFGKAINAVVGHRIAEACVHRFVGDVARHLRQAVV